MRHDPFESNSESDSDYIHIRLDLFVSNIHIEQKK